jgi:hypothetical protein
LASTRNSLSNPLLAAEKIPAHFNGEKKKQKPSIPILMFNFWSA